MAAPEFRPLMEENAGTRNTTLQFLRSFSIISDDSDFDELDEPDTPGDYLDGPAGDVAVHHTTTAGICVDTTKVTDHAEGKIIPYTNVHKPRKGFTHIRPDCWMRETVKVAITDVKREEHPHMTRKAFNPNLYNIEVTHGEYKWTVRRRYKHFDSLHKALRLFRARYSLPMPSKQHREMRQSIREERKERKIKKKQTKKICRFPKKPEWLVRGEALEKRRGHLEQYLQSILESKWYRNHTELLKFLDVSELSFINKLGKKWKEGDVNKCSGGRRISIGCCGCLKKYHVAGRWSDRWLIVKDTFVAYTRPSDGVLCDVMLMDSDFKVESGMSATGAPHGLLITNLSRVLLAKCWTSRKADEWEEGIHQAAITTGKQFTEPNRYDSYAPVREKSYARWFVDGSTYFEAVADALEKAKEEIFITDWWLSPEIYLKRHVTDREKWRLDEILARKAKSGVKVFILLYKELEIALTINSWYSKTALRNKCPENIKVIRHPDHVAGGNRVLLWAHHEKMVVIDQKTAFLGGLDLCYGRWDDDQHRMTDLGSVTFNSSSNNEDKQTTERDNPNVLNPSSHNGAVNRHKNHLRKMKAASNIPSPILETQESNIGDSVDIEDHAGNKPTGSHTQPSINSNDIETRSQQIHRSADDLHIAGKEHSGINSSETARHSLCSEKDFGSGDILTDNDSLENVDKTGYTNVIAEVTVHSDGTAGSSYNQAQQKSLSITGASTDGSQPGSVTPCSPKCNNSQNNDISAVHSNDLTLVNGDYNGNKKVERQVSSSSLSLKIEDIRYQENREVDLDKIEKQIIRDNDCSEEGLTTPKKDTDLNKNETKASVRFKEDSEVKEENIVPTQAVLIEGSPRVKKDAAAKRETWASRKLRKRFGFKGDKYEEDDATDGAKSDKEKSDSDDESGGSRLRHKWRMVLNIKKLEHASKRPEDEDTMAPVSPRSRGNPHSPRQPLTTRIRQSMPFRTQRQDSDDELYFSLYPWKKMWRKDDGGPVTVKSVMKTSVADDYEGLEGSSKLWIGKDYVNFIHKDPVDVANPFEDFIARDKTPRMPWHDIGAVVYGKAARDVARHFIRRWNFCKTLKFKTKKEYPLLMPKCYTKCEVAPGIKDITYEVNSQILRSVSKWSAGINKVEMSIHNAYIDCIAKAKHYIYIENQFFISQVGDHSQVKNEIAEALLKRIEKAYREKETFRVYVVLPLLPAFEGEIGENGGYAIQAVLHWNYKSISKGPNSLFQQLQSRVDDPKKYLLFCGLRSHAELAGKLVTELVYVHSKLMIVDDDTVIIGSANINDRSMLGNRDSEMAVLVEDTQKFMVKMDGKDHMVGNFASSLRRTIFREHLGIGEHDFDIDLTDPISDKFYKNVWLHQASTNTTIYYKVFKCIPDDHIKTFYEIKESSASPLAETDPAAAKEELKKVKGRLVLMPLYFLEHEETIMAAGANKEGLMPMKLWL